MTSVKLPEQLRPLAKVAKKQGWSIDIDGKSRVIWTRPDGTVLRTTDRRELAKELGVNLPGAGKAARPAPPVRPAGVTVRRKPPRVQGDAPPMVSLPCGRCDTTTNVQARPGQTVKCNTCWNRDGVVTHLIVARRQAAP